MKRLNPTTNQPYRCGDTDKLTGMMFRCYDMTKMRKDGTYVEQWLTPESFAAIKERMRLRAQARREADYFKRVRTTKQIIEALN